MNKFITAVIAIVAGLALILGIGNAVGGNNQSSLLGNTRFPNGITTAGTLTVGTSGTAVSKVLTGQVNCAAGAASLVTGGLNTYDCAVTGVASGDNVLVTLGNTVSGVVVARAYASTTASGYFELVLGSATSTSVAVGAATTSVSYIITR